MVEKVQLKAKTLTSKAAKDEVKALLPAAKIFMKRHVPAVGYVIYVKDISGKTIAQLTKTNDYLQLYVLTGKNNPDKV